ncbi:MAG: hypothetical protein O3B01_28545 [Planctomycetota bacterium]|nr:hypothetical protein [Planctomycetota bacterium]MDA1142531.1 hypothetical protein [Planctomycetota bacterium]
MTGFLEESEEEQEHPRWVNLLMSPTIVEAGYIVSLLDDHDVLAIIPNENSIMDIGALGYPIQVLSSQAETATAVLIEHQFLKTTGAVGEDELPHWAQTTPVVSYFLAFVFLCLAAFSLGYLLTAKKVRLGVPLYPQLHDASRR